MRPSCLFCVRKHLSKALVLLSECKLGYPQHRDLVIGNMSEAEDEAVKEHPAIAHAIRAERLKYEKDANYCPQVERLLKEVHASFPAGMSGFAEATSRVALVGVVGLVAAFWFLKRKK